MNSDWLKYYEQTKDYPHEPLVEQALIYVEKNDRAVDLGSGAFRNTRYLISKGFEVTAVDAVYYAEDSRNLHELFPGQFEYSVNRFEEYSFPLSGFDLAVAIYSLPFINVKDFEDVFISIKTSLFYNFSKRRNGVFCGQFFGLNDGWNDDSSMTFHSKNQITDLLHDMDILFLEEKEYDEKTAAGKMKHWHVFDVISRMK